MKIAVVEALLIAIPLRRPTSMSNQTVISREYVVTRVRTDDGIAGSACRPLLLGLVSNR